MQQGYELTRVTVDPQLLVALQKNLVTFSLFKNHQNMREVADLLTVNGKLRSYEEFEAEALKVSVNYNQTWLKSEYETAVASSKSASQWVDIQASKKEYPTLQYHTCEDHCVRDEHVLFDKTTLPVGHAWWNTHFPPNGFRCRCFVTKHQDSEGLPLTKKPNEESYHDEFNFNPGKAQQIFGDNHTYFKNLSQETVDKLKEYSETVSLKRNKWW